MEFVCNDMFFSGWLTSNRFHGFEVSQVELLMHSCLTVVVCLSLSLSLFDPARSPFFFTRGVYSLRALNRI